MALLVKIGAELTDLKKELNKATKEIQEVGKTLSNTGSTLTKYVTLPILGIGAAAVATSSNFDAAMSEVAAISGATGKDLEMLREKAKKMGETTKFSATESADALKYMAMAGWGTEQMVDGLDGILNLAAASNTELGITSDIVTDALTAFGLSAKDSTHFADVMAQTANKSNTSIELMGETFKYVAPIAGALGYSVEDTSVAIGLMANAGIKGSQAGTTLKNAFANLVKPTAQMQEEMDKLGISATNSDGSMKSLNQLLREMRTSFNGLSDAEKASAASTIFGKEAMSGMLAVINTSDEDFNNLTASISNADGAALTMAETMQNNLQGDMTTLSSALEGAGIKIGEILEPALRGIVQTLTDAVAWFNNLDSSQMQLIMTIAGIVAAIGPLLLIGGQLIIFISKVQQGFSLLSTALGGVTFSISSLLIPIALVVAAFLLMWNTSESFRTAIGDIFGGIMEIFQGLADFVTGIFTGDWDMAFAGLGTIASGFQKIVIGVVDAIQSVFNVFDNWLGKVFSTDWSTYFGGFGDILNGFLANVSNIWNSIKTVFNGIITFVKGVFTGNWSQAWNGVVNIFKGIIDGIASVFKAPMNGVIGLINAAIGALNTISVDIPDWIPGIGGKKFGFDLQKLPYLAKGGNVFKGSAIFGEAGPELLTVSGGTTRVTPLSGGSSSSEGIIDYDKMTSSFIAAIKYLRMYLGEDVLAQFVDERLLKVM